MRFSVLMSVVAVFFISAGLYSEELQNVSSEKITVPADIQQFPFLGRVKGRNINVRGGNNLNFEVLTQLQDQDSVIVLGESSSWYQIDPPQTAFLWINKDYVKGGIVSADAVNVRGSPSLSGTLNCQLARNDIVEVVAEEGEWLKIKPPAQAKAWISRDYVVYEKPLDQDINILKDERAKALQETRKKKMLEAAQAFEEAEFYKPVGQIQVDGIVASYQNILNEFPNDDVLKSTVTERMTAVKSKAEKLHIAGHPDVYVEDGPMTLAQSDRSAGIASSALIHEDARHIDAQTASKPVVEQNNSAASVLPSSENEKNAELNDPDLQMFRGRLEWAGGFGRGKKYKLIENRKRICILMEKDFSLYPFVHQNVKIYGKIISWIYPHIPVVRVIRVEKS